MSGTARMFREMLDSLPPAPKFDCAAVHDIRVFHSIPRRDPAPSALLAGVPVIVDEKVEVGVIELRKGDEVYKRVLLSELRA